MKIFESIEKHLMPVMNKLSANIYLKAIRNGMVQIIPLVIVGSMFLVVLNIPIPAYMEWIGQYSDTLVIPFRLTVYMMSVYVAFGIGGSLGEERGLHPVTAGIIGLIGYMMTIIPMTGDLYASGDTTEIISSGWMLSFGYLGSAGLFGAIVTSIISVEILYFMKKHNLTIKMPEQVPASVGNSFAALFPTAVVIILFWFITVVVGFNVHDFFNTILSPFQDFFAGGNLIGALFTVFLITLFWSAGIHGVSVLGGLLRPFWQIALEENASLVADGVAANALPNITPEPFFQWFVWIGGSGGTLGLLIATFIIARSTQLKTISRLSIVPGIFNINEPVIFGYPIVLNPVLIIPFIVGPLIITVVSYFTLTLGLVNTPYILAAWTLPGPIGAMIATADFKAAILVIVNIIILTIVYLPFVRIYDKQLLAEEDKVTEEAVVE